MDIETKRITDKSPNFLTIHCSLEDINIFLPQELCMLEPNYHKSYCSQFYKLFVCQRFSKSKWLDMSSTKTVTLSSQNSFSPIFICQQSTEFQKLKPENPSVIIRDFVNMGTTGLREYYLDSLRYKKFSQRREKIQKCQSNMVRRL